MAKKEQKQGQKEAPKSKAALEAQTSKLKKNQAEMCVEALKAALLKLDDGYLDVARLCWEATEEKYWKDLKYASPGDFFFDKFGMKARKAAYYADIHGAVIRCGLTESQIKGIGWAKLALIAPILTSDNLAEWLEEARTLSHKDLAEKIAIVKGRRPRKEVKTQMKLDLSEDKAVFIENGIQAALRIIGGDSEGEALVHIVTEWLQFTGTSEEAIELPSWIDYLEKKFPIKLEYTVIEDETGEPITENDPEIDSDEGSGEDLGEGLEDAGAEDLDTALLDSDLDDIPKETAPEEKPVKAGKKSKKSKKSKKDKKDEGEKGGKASGKKAEEPEPAEDDDDLLLD